MEEDIDMSLLDIYMQEFILYNEAIVDDGYGGYKTTWTEGIHFQGALKVNNSMESQLAQKQGVTAIYTLTTSRSLTLKYHNVIKRVTDGKVFRITSDGDDVKTPTSTILDMRQVSAEEWRLTSDATDSR